MKILAQNKKALHDYQILDRLEAGLVLNGDEVKSIKAGQASLIGSFATVKDGELLLINCSVPAYEKAFRKADDEVTRARKLLLHRRELDRLIGDISRKGITVVPLKLYSGRRGLIKVELGIAKHRKAAGKKQLLKERDIKRETQRELKGKYNY